MSTQIEHVKTVILALNFWLQAGYRRSPVLRVFVPGINWPNGFRTHRRTVHGLDPENSFYKHITCIGQVLETASGDPCWATNRTFVGADQPPGRREVGCALTTVFGSFISGLSWTS